MMKKILIITFFLLQACTSFGELEPISASKSSVSFPEYLVDEISISDEISFKDQQIAYCQISKQDNDTGFSRNKWEIAVRVLNEENIHYVSHPIPEATAADLGCDGYPVSGSSRSIAGLDWSPDGQQLLFNLTLEVIGIADIADDGSTTSSIPFLSPPKYTFYQFAHAPTWSPDGTHVAFISRFQEGATEIGEKLFAPSLFVANADGTNPRYFIQEDRLPGVVSNPVWSNDGTKIAYILPVPKNGIGIIDIQSSEVTQLDSELVAEFPTGTNELHGLLPSDSIAWLPGDKLILMLTNSDKSTEDLLWAVEPDGSNPLKLYQGSIQQIEVSPNGRSVAIITETQLGKSSIYTISLTNEAEMENILEVINWKHRNENSLYIRDLNWSSDGRYLAFAANPNGNFDIFAWDIKQTQILSITDTREFDEIAPRWRPVR